MIMKCVFTFFYFTMFINCSNSQQDKMNFQTNSDCLDTYNTIKSFADSFGTITYRQELYYSKKFNLLSSDATKKIGCYYSILTDSSISIDIRLMISSIIIKGLNEDQLLEFCNKYVNEISIININKSIMGHLLISQDDNYFFVRNYNKPRIRKLYQKLLAKNILTEEEKKQINEILDGTFWQIVNDNI